MGRRHPLFARLVTLGGEFQRLGSGAREAEGVCGLEVRLRWLVARVCQVEVCELRVLVLELRSTEQDGQVYEVPPRVD